MMTEMLDCQAVMAELWDYLDQELTPDRMALISAHLAKCGRCFPQLKFRERFLRTLEQARAEPGASAPLRERVVRALDAEGLTNPG
jgi:mycothiol system anti-sigma-R factor